VIDPIFWLGLSILLVAVSITAVLVVAVPAFQELGKAARSAEKLFDTLNRELPPTLEAIRLTGLEISELTDDVSQGVQSAGQVVKQVDRSITDAKQQVQKVQTTSRSVFAGMRAAWRTFTQAPKSRRNEGVERGSHRLSSGRAAVSMEDSHYPSHFDRYRDDAFEPQSYPEPEDFEALADEPLEEEVSHFERNGSNGNRILSEPWDQTSRSPEPRRPVRWENEP
jgi:uncharacterized protein YoxC